MKEKYQESELWDLWDEIKKELGIDLDKHMVRNKDGRYWTEYDLYELDSDKKETE